MKWSGLETLLDLDGEILVQEHGCWIKIEAKRVEEDMNRPHGIKYSLTLHAASGERLMGFDNAHGVGSMGRGKAKRHAARHVPYDHRHPFDSSRAVHYEFATPEQLLGDFFAEVDKVLKRVNRK